MAWGSQGYLVVAFYQGSKILKDLDKYVPPKNRLAPLAREDNGNILAVGILGPAETPTHPSDEGWFHEVTPMGMNASMHRIVGLWRPATPYTPVNSYHLGGGLMLLHATDMHRLCHLMAEQVLAHPWDALFEGYVPTTPSAYTMAGIHSLLHCQPSDDTEDAEFPAHDGFIGGRKDPSLPRVSRINQRNTAPVRVSELLRYAPEDNAGFAKAWPVKIIDGGYAMDYHAMPDPIPC